MIGLDTNVLIRLITSDDPGQTEAAVRFIREQCTSEEPGFVSLVVLCELVWSLKRTYDFNRSEIAIAIDGVLQNSVLEVEHRSLVTSASQQYRTGGIDFADLLIAEINRANGCDATVTFDRRAAKLKGFTLIR